MKIVFTLIVLFASTFATYAQMGCGTVTIPLNIEDSAEVARREPFGLDSSEALMYLIENGYPLKEAYLKKLEKDTPEILARFKKKEKEKKEKENKGKGNNSNGNSRTMADANGLDYIEIRFWRHLDAYTNAPLVPNSIFQNDINFAITILNQDFAANNIPFRFYAACSNPVFKTSQYNTSTQRISKSDAEKVIEITANSARGIDVFYFAGSIIGNNGIEVNFANFPDSKRNYYVGATQGGLLSRTITHEIGHVFGLEHTHAVSRGLGDDNMNASGCYQESVSRTRRNYWYNGCSSTDTYLKCEINGDRMADTEASFKNLKSYLNENGTYNNGGGTDNWGDAWNPPVNNFMSYAINWTEFSPMQIARIIFYANTRKVNSYLTMTGPARLCVGTNGTYSVSNAGTTNFQWSLPAGFSIVSGQGTNTVTVRNNSSANGGVISVNLTGCGAFGASRKIEGSNNFYYIVGNNIVAPGTWSQVYSVSNGNIAGTTYSWTAPPNSTIISGGTSSGVSLRFANNFNGGYLTARQTTSCGTASSTIYIQPTNTGGDPFEPYALDNTELNFRSYHIYPNPSNGFLTLNFKNPGYTVQLLSLNNQLYSEASMLEGENKLDYSHFPKAMYVMKIMSPTNEIFTEKIILQ